MKIASFNIDGINGRLDVLLRWPGEVEPDVVCPQEVKTQTERLPADAIDAAGYRAIWRGQKSRNGVAPSG